MEKLDDILQVFKSCLQQSDLSTQMLITQTTKFSLRLQYRCYNNKHIHHIDILPCLDLLGHTPTFGTLAKLYNVFGVFDSFTVYMLELDCYRTQKGSLPENRWLPKQKVPTNLQHCTITIASGFRKATIRASARPYSTRQVLETHYCEPVHWFYQVTPHWQQYFPIRSVQC